MGYNKAKAKTVYQPMRSMTTFSPAMHEAFRREWEANFESAIEKAMQLAKQGFHVEECLQKGAMMESKAKRLSEQLEKQGFTVELIPIARWGKEQAVFLVYKPPEKPVPPPPPKPKFKPMDAKQIIQGFYRHFEAIDDLAHFENKGYAMDRRRIVALIDMNKDNTISERGRKAKQSGFLTKFYNDSRFRSALLRLKRAHKTFVYLDADEKYVATIDTLSKVLRALGDGPVSVYAIDDGPIYFFNERAVPDNIAIAYAPPTAIDTNVSNIFVTVDDVIAFAEANLGYKRR